MLYADRFTSMNILHLPDNVAGNASGLAAGERALGHQSSVLALHRSPYGFPADRQLAVEERGRLGRIATYLATFLRVRSGYDLYHFAFGSSLWHFPARGLYLLDLPFYSARAKKVVTYQGCDARQKYPTMRRNEGVGERIAACFETECYGGMCNSGRKDRERQASIEKAARHADHLFALNPDLLHFLPREKASFLPYAIDGFDRLPARSGPFFAGDVVHIVHAPTQRAAKGSSYVLRALAGLEEAFPGRLRVTLVENVDRATALRIIATADLLIDQVLIGWYGGVAVEAMKMGVPVACFINDRDLALIPPAMAAEMPLLRVTPFDLKDRLAAFLRERDQAPELARRGTEYVARWHDPRAVARQVFRTVFGSDTPA